MIVFCHPSLVPIEESLTNMCRKALMLNLILHGYMHAKMVYRWQGNFLVKDRVEQSNIYVSSRLVLKGKGSPPIESSNSLTFLARCVTLGIYLILNVMS